MQLLTILTKLGVTVAIFGGISDLGEARLSLQSYIKYVILFLGVHRYLTIPLYNVIQFLLFKPIYEKNRELYSLSHVLLNIKDNGTFWNNMGYWDEGLKKDFVNASTGTSC